MTEFSKYSDFIDDDGFVDVHCHVTMKDIAYEAREMYPYLPRWAIEDILNAMLQVMRDALIAGKAVELAGFGVFSLATGTVPYSGVHPRTGEPYLFKPRVYARLCLHKELAKRLEKNDTASFGD